MAPRRPCSAPYCASLIPPPCPVHGRRAWEHDRPSAAARGYGTAWRKLRAWVLVRDGHACVPCREAGRLTAAASVDHITPKTRGGTDDASNLQSICAECHRTKSAREGQAASHG